MIQHSSPSRLKLLTAFASIYLVWGSTYLAIAFAIETMPPLLMLGARFLVAGLLVFGWLRLKGHAVPSGPEVRNASVVGTMTLGLGTGTVAWAEQWVPTGMAALLITTTPVWMVLLDWKWKGAPRPNAYVFWGMAMGVAGIILLVNPTDLALGREVLIGAVAILGATLAFATGAIMGRDRELPPNALMSAAMQMIGGGVALFVGGSIRGELALVEPAAITGRSWLALAYLMVFGSIIAYGSFVWLMKNARTTQVSTHAYVNPIVAVLLGWLFAGEIIDARVLGAIALLTWAVLLITRFGSSSRVSLGGGTSRMALRERWAPLAEAMPIHPLEIWRAFAHAMDRPATSLPRREERVARAR